MAAIHTYLNFDGNTEEAFKFYRSVFGGEFETIQKMSDTPMGAQLSEDEKRRVMHVALPIGKGSVLMGSDIMPSMGHKLAPGNNCHITIVADSREEADRLFTGLSAGGKVTMPLETAFWGSYFGMFNDKFGVQWMVSFDEKNVK